MKAKRCWAIGRYGGKRELGNFGGGGLEEFSLFKCSLLNEADIYPA